MGLCDEAAFATRTKAATGDAGAGGATDAATGDAHGLMLARLAHELGERKQLCEQERALQARRALLRAGIDARRGFLDDLGAQLASVKRATLPLQHTLRLPLALQERRRSAARLLPPPLYTLYTQLAAAREAFAEEGDFGVDVVGSVADAESLVREAAAAEEELTRRSASDTVIINAAPAGCEDGDEEDGGRVAKRAKRSRVSGSRGVASPSPSSAAPTYAAHPLAVELVLSPAVTLTFRYLTALHIVTVEAHAPEASPVLDDDLLVNLFPGDAGDDTPNTANKLGQHGVVINLGTRTRASGTGTLGVGGWGRRDRPFLWAQHLAGLDFLPAVPPGRALPDAVSAAAGVAMHQQQARVRTVLAALRARVATRASLNSQLEVLGGCDVGGLVAAGRLEMRPACALLKWREVGGIRGGMLEISAGGVGGAGTSGDGGTEDGELGPGGGTAGLLAGVSPGSLASAIAMRNIPPPLPCAPVPAGTAAAAAAATAAAAAAAAAAAVVVVAAAAAAAATDDTSTAAAFAIDGGARVFRADIRAARQMSSDPVEIAAEVIVFPEYPHRPPVFALRLAHGVPPKPLPPSDLSMDNDAGGKGVGDGVGDEDEDVALDVGDAANDLRLMEDEVNFRCLDLVPAGAADQTLGYQVMRLMQAVDAAAACERWGGASDEAVGGRQMRRGRERRKELPPK